jgi:hypothetical protein
VRISSRLARIVIVLVAPLLLVVSVPAHATSAPANPSGAEHTFGDTSCRLIATRYAGAIGTGSCPGIRPGAITYKRISKTIIGVCTLNFIFKGRDGYTYAGTAGHCITESYNFERKWPGYTGPKAYYNPYGPPYNNQRYIS